MKILKRILIGLLILVVISTLGFVIWAETPSQPSVEAITALRSDADVTVSVEDYVTFRPAVIEPGTAFVFYPGGRVDYRAYAAPLHEIAKQGYLVILLPVRFNLAFFDVNAADKVIDDFPQIRHWVLGGHSLGGVAASLYAAKRDVVDGIVFWASYPAGEELKNTEMKVLSVYGTLDMGGMEAFEASRATLPPEAQFVVIAGGNHAQFGDYGVQPGDNEATITRTEQQSQAVEATVQFLSSFDD